MSSVRTSCNIALIEDDKTMAESMLERFRIEAWSTEYFKSCCMAETNWEQILSADVVISDFRLPDGNGMELFARYKEKNGTSPFIMITAYASISDAVQLMREGLHDYWIKPFDIEEAVGKLHELLDTDALNQEPVLGHCKQMREAERLLRKIASSRVNVLITGETGTGKGEAVKYLHAISLPDKPLVTINSGSIPRDLLESELFGYEKGAFTGASARKIGQIEMAHGGILFLDEIGDMPLEIQVKLLHVIQEKKLTRLGGHEEIPVDFRLVCATHRNLRALVQEGKFREDLYYRINVVHVKLPPLRERGADVLWLANRFINEFTENSHVRGLLPEAEMMMLNHHFSGNVRELRNRVERAVVLAERALLTAMDIFPEQLDGDAPHIESHQNFNLKEVVHDTERKALIDAYNVSGGSVSKAAELLGISRKTFWEKTKKLKVELDKE